MQHLQAHLNRYFATTLFDLIGLIQYSPMRHDRFVTRIPLNKKMPNRSMLTRNSILERVSRGRSGFSVQFWIIFYFNYSIKVTDIMMMKIILSRETNILCLSHEKVKSCFPKEICCWVLRIRKIDWICSEFRRPLFSPLWGHWFECLRFWWIVTTFKWEDANCSNSDLCVRLWKMSSSNYSIRKLLLITAYIEVKIATIELD